MLLCICYEFIIVTQSTIEIFSWSSGIEEVLRKSVKQIMHSFLVLKLK